MELRCIESLNATLAKFPSAVIVKQPLFLKELQLASNKDLKLDRRLTIQPYCILDPIQFNLVQPDDTQKSGPHLKQAHG